MLGSLDHQVNESNFNAAFAVAFDVVIDLEIDLVGAGFSRALPFFFCLNCNFLSTLTLKSPRPLTVAVIPNEVRNPESLPNA
jgi:hypothetical protein